MAAKRNSPGNTPRNTAKKPVAKSAPVAASSRKPVVAQAVIRRNGTGSTPIAPLPVNPVDIRAEQEPAVVVAPSVQETLDNQPDNQAETHDWAPAPVQLTWWERMFGGAKRSSKPAKREKATQMAENMAVVKASVLQELETMGVKKGVAVQGSPFRNILLPVAPKKTQWKWPVLGLVVLAILVVMVWVGRQPEAPAAVLAQALAAARNHDVRTFEAKVDVASVASSVVNQMFSLPQQGSKGEMAARMTAFIKPGLADALKDDILATVGGDAMDTDSDSLLAKMWVELGGDKMRLGVPNVAMQDAHMAVAEVPLLRQDLGLALPLQVVMTPAANGTWQVVDVPNLAAVLGSVVQAEKVLVERRAAAAAADAARAGAVAADIRIENVKKVKDGDAQGSSNIILSMALANVGHSDAKNVPLDVAFADAAGQPMMTTRVTLDGALPAGARREQVWSIPVNRAHAAERYVADLPLSALTVTVTVVK